ERIVKQWGIRMRATRFRNLILLVYGILHSQSGNLSAIVRHWPNGARQHIHRLKRIHRFLKNPGVEIERYFPVLAAVIWPYRPGGGHTSLYPVILDWTKVHQEHVLFAALPRKKRALPLAYGVYHPQRLRKSQNQLERGMLTLLTSLLLQQAGLVVLADAGFGQTELIRWLQERQINYVVRLRAETLVHYRGKTQPLGNLDTHEFGHPPKKVKPPESDKLGLPRPHLLRKTTTA
ncbi:MAG: transposase, partial [Chloroflexota bacterium]